MITLIDKAKVSETMNNEPSAKEKDFDWMDWYERVSKLYIEAQKHSDDELFNYNLGTQITETRMLLEMKHLIKPLNFVVVIPEE